MTFRTDNTNVRLQVIGGVIWVAEFGREAETVPQDKNVRYPIGGALKRTEQKVPIADLDQPHCARGERTAVWPLPHP